VCLNPKDIPPDDLDLPDGADDPTLPPQINVTLVQAVGSTAPVRKSTTINGKEYPVQLSKGNRIISAVDSKS
jgi:hypothetical protein